VVAIIVAKEKQRTFSWNKTETAYIITKIHSQRQRKREHDTDRKREGEGALEPVNLAFNVVRLELEFAFRRQNGTCWENRKAFRSLKTFPGSLRKMKILPFALKMPVTQVIKNLSPKREEQQE